MKSRNKKINKPKKDWLNHKITKRKAKENLTQSFNQLDHALKTFNQNQSDHTWQIPKSIPSK